MSNNLNKKNVYCVMDIGSSSVKTVIAQRRQLDWDILGFGMHHTEGMKKGTILDIEKVSRGVQLSFEEAKLGAEHEPQYISASISGVHTDFIDTIGIAPIKQGKVSQQDIQQAQEASKAIPLPDGHRILHSFYQTYSIDHLNGIIEPLNMSGVRLEAHAKLITASVHSVKNILEILSLQGAQAQHLVLDGLAGALAVMLPDEKELGIAIVDIGAGTAKITIFHQNKLVFTKTIPYGSDSITSDIALALRTPLSAAETIKLRHGSVRLDFGQYQDNNLNIPAVGQKKHQQINRQDLISIITPRVEEILQLLLTEVKNSHCEHLFPCGVILTGGGAKLENLCTLVENIFNAPVRIGIPLFSQKFNEALDSPVCATVMGLLEWSYNFDSQIKRNEPKDWGLFWNRIRNWLTG